MYLLRNDPIVDEISASYKAIRADDFTEEEFVNKIKYFFSERNLIEAVAHTLKGIEIFNNNLKIKLLNYDALFRLGFFLDAQIAIEKCFFIQKSRNILVFERIFELYMKISKYDKVILLCQENINILLNSERATRQYIDFLKNTRNYKIYNYIFDFYEDKVIHILKGNIKRDIFELKEYKLHDLIILNQSSDKIDFNVAMEHIWGLYHQGERSLYFFRLACKAYEGENHTSTRLIFFNQQAFENYNEEIDFLIEYAHNLVFRKFYEHAYYYLKNINAEQFITNPFVLEYQRNRLYYFIIKLNSLVEDRSRTILTNEEAQRFHTMKPFYLDFCRQYSLALKDKMNLSYFEKEIEKFPESVSNVIHYIVFKISSIVSPVENQLVDLNLAGQMRGGLNSVANINEIVGENHFNKVFFSSWDIQPVFPPRTYALWRLIGVEPARLLTEQFRNTSYFKMKFPLFSQKIFSSEGIKLNFDVLNKINAPVEYYIANEKPFNAHFENKQDFLIGKKLYQAKMFFHFYNSSQGFSQARVILRKRPDMKNHIIFKMDDYFKALSKNDNYLYINYFDHNLGFSDRFSLGSHASIRKIAAIWETALKFDKLIYADFFDDYTHAKAAEHLMSSHIVACGIKTRYIHCLREDFIESDSLGDIPLSDEFEADFQNLTAEERMELQDFYAFMNEKLV